jgi:hypothetical protein
VIKSINVACHLVLGSHAVMADVQVAIDHSKPALHAAGLKSASHEGLDHMRLIGEREDAHRSRSHDYNRARYERVAEGREFCHLCKS